MATGKIQLGLWANRRMFLLLVLITAFIGSMVGLERTVLPLLAEERFGVVSKTALMSFLVAFGGAKAVANYWAGRLAEHQGRKKLLLWGWALAIPVPWILQWATHWEGIVFANVLLGLSQGLAWSSTVVMKIDLVGERERGLAMGVNEFAGYIAVGGMALYTGLWAHRHGLTPYLFHAGVVIAIGGFLLSLWVRDTRDFARQETALRRKPSPFSRRIFMETTFYHKTLSAVTQAGMVNNLNDSMMWGLLPIFLAARHFKVSTIGWVASAYPIMWGIAQLFTGKMADHYSPKAMLFWGMFLQGVTILIIPFVEDIATMCVLSVLLGVGTALVYPTFLAVIADTVHPLQRAESIGTFRLWRDLGYVFGAVLSGVAADWFGVPIAIALVGWVTLISAVILAVRMPKQGSKSQH